MSQDAHQWRKTRRAADSSVRLWRCDRCGESIWSAQMPDPMTAFVDATCGQIVARRVMQS